MHATAPPARRTWPWIVGAAILIGALIIAGAVYYGIQAGTATPTAEPTTPASSSTATPSTTPVDTEPTGCLGGEARDAHPRDDAPRRRLGEPEGDVGRDGGGDEGERQAEA